jgi:hypothetical protein
MIFSGAMDAWHYRAAPTSQFTRFWRSLIAEAALAAPPRLQLRLTPGVRPAEPACTARGSHSTDRDRTGKWDRPYDASPIAADVVGPDGNAQMIRLWPSIDAGVFTGDIRVATTGVHNVRVTTNGGASADSALVVDPQAALTRSPSRIAQDIPELTGGVAAESSDLTSLVQHPARLPRPEYRTMIHPWRSPWWMGPFALALCGEWVLRRRRGQR